MAGSSCASQTSIADGLASRGIPGLHYRDPSKIGAAGRNYVVFDPAVIDIMKRYGVTAPIAASMLAAQHESQPQAGAAP